MTVHVPVMMRIFTLMNLGGSDRGVPVPVFVAMGLHDYVVPPTLWNEPRKRMSTVTYHLFEKSGHTPQLEEPQLFDQRLIEWFRQN